MSRKIKNYNEKKEKKIREKEEAEEKAKELQKKKDMEIKPFSLKSAGAILGSAIIGSMVIPAILGIFGVDTRWGVLLGSSLFTSFGFTWTRFFIDSKQGYTKAFWKQYIIFAIIFGMISYFWLFRQSFI